MKKSATIATLFVFFWIVIDQISKHLVRQSDRFYICNNGVAFGLYIPEIVFWAIWMSMFGLIGFYLFKNKSEIHFLILIISGALSNAIDRLYLGCVIDFIDIKIFNYPLFNLADTLIVTGAIMLVVSKIKKENKK
jgi:signal peptidase II